jgi:hypothetical protein
MAQIVMWDERKITYIAIEKVTPAAAYDVVRFIEEAVEPAKKNTNNNEQSCRDAPQKPYRPPPVVGSRRKGFRRPALPDGCARGHRDRQD